MFEMSLRQNSYELIVGFAILIITSFPLQADMVSLSHTEGKGLGYSQGYTSLDLFISQAIEGPQTIAFADLRGHVFNNSKYASNTGLGMRSFNACSNLVCGLNFFYDSFLLERLPYHQASIGLEALCETFEFRFNGYLPVGRRKTPIYTLDYDFSSGFLAKAREQLAMGGFDVELGSRFCNCQSFNLYTGIGPYAYWGRSLKTKNAFRATRRDFVGGRLRVITDFFCFFRLEGITTYDSRFKWTGQATLSFNIPLNWNCNLSDDDDVCDPCLTLSERLFQPVLRNEMIVINKINRSSSNPAILDPENEP